MTGLYSVSQSQNAVSCKLLEFEKMPDACKIMIQSDKMNF